MTVMPGSNVDGHAAFCRPVVIAVIAIARPQPHRVRPYPEPWSALSARPNSEFPRNFNTASTLNVMHQQRRREKKRAGCICGFPTVTHRL